MQWFPLFAVVVAAGLSGCLDANADGSNPFGLGNPSTCAGIDPQLATESGQYGMILPATAAETTGEAVTPRIRVTVDALEGQTLVASASWVAQGGFASVLFEAPAGGIESETTNTYSWTGTVPAGHYAIEIEGDPMAYNVVAAVSLVATGCPTA